MLTPTTVETTRTKIHTDSIGGKTQKRTGDSEASTEGRTVAVIKNKKVSSKFSRGDARSSFNVPKKDESGFSRTQRLYQSCTNFLRRKKIDSKPEASVSKPTCETPEARQNVALKAVLDKRLEDLTKSSKLREATVIGLVLSLQCKLDDLVHGVYYDGPGTCNEAGPYVAPHQFRDCIGSVEEWLRKPLDTQEQGENNPTAEVGKDSTVPAELISQRLLLRRSDWPKEKQGTAQGAAQGTAQGTGMARAAEFIY